MICASIISHRTAESQSAGGGQTHNETESSHSTASLIFILFMQGVGYLRSKFLSGCAGLGSRSVLCNFKVKLGICKEHKRLRSEKEIKKCGKNVAISAMNTAKISLIQDEAEKLDLCCFLLEIRELKW